MSYSFTKNMLWRGAYFIEIVQRKLKSIYPHTKNKRGLINGLRKIKNGFSEGTLQHN